MLQSPENKIIVQVTTRYIKNMTELLRRSMIQQGSSLHQQDFVNITGKVISIPKRISDRIDYVGFSTKDIKVGDTAIFSYEVIFDQIVKPGAEEAVYKNMVQFKGQEYWMADITRVFGVIRDGEIIMVNGFVMATPFEEQKIILSQEQTKQKGCTKSTLMHIGNSKTTEAPIQAKIGDTIYYNPTIAQKYQINDKPFIILTQRQILGRSETT